MDSLQDLENLFRYYFKTVWEKAGLKWNQDNDAEISAMVASLARAIQRKEVK